MAKRQESRTENISIPQEMNPKKGQFIFDQFVSVNIDPSMTQSFRSFCASKTSTVKLNFSDIEVLNKLKNEFLNKGVNK